MGFKQTRFINPFPQIMQRVKPAAGEVSKETANEVLDLALQYVPVVSGELRDSGMVEQVSDTRYIVKFTAAHAKWVNYGTAFQASNPFFSIAFFLSREVFKRKRREFFQRLGV